MIRRTLLHANERGSFRETPCRDFRLTTALAPRPTASPADPHLADMVPDRRPRDLDPRTGSTRLRSALDRGGRPSSRSHVRLDYGPS